MIEDQDDMTLVYMWAYKQAEKKYKARIEQLEAALREILSNNPIRGDTGSSTLKEIVEAILKSSVIARAALGEKKDD